VFSKKFCVITLVLFVVTAVGQLLAEAPPASTVIVGTCSNQFPQYPTIQQAVNAFPPEALFTFARVIIQGK
jgi:hypothetical protein